MPKRSTKPRKEDGPKQPSRQIRVKEDLGLMIAWIVRIKGESSPDLVDPYLRAAIRARYDSIREKAEAMKREEPENSTLPEIPDLND